MPGQETSQDLLRPRLPGHVATGTRWASRRSSPTCRPGSSSRPVRSAAGPPSGAPLWSDSGFRATNSRVRMSVLGRPLPTADVGCPVAQLGSQLSGGEIAHPAVAGRPVTDTYHPRRLAAKPPFAVWQRAAAQGCAAAPCGAGTPRATCSAFQNGSTPQQARCSSMKAFTS